MEQSIAAIDKIRKDGDLISKVSLISYTKKLNEELGTRFAPPSIKRMAIACGLRFSSAHGNSRELLNAKLFELEERISKLEKALA